VIEEEDRDLFVRYVAGIDAAMGAISGLISVGLPDLDRCRQW